MKKYLLLSFLLSVFFAKAQHAFFRGTNNYVAPVVAPPTPSNALDFDGINDYVENTTLVINPSLGFTIEGWMKVNDFGYSAMATQTINNYPAPFDMYVINGSGNVSFLVGQGSVTGSVTSSTALTIGSWAHLAFVYNPSIAKIQIPLIIHTIVEKRHATNEVFPGIVIPNAILLPLAGKSHCQTSIHASPEND